jgi:hypothetical protein
VLQHSIEELKVLMAARLTLEEVLDILDMDFSELLDVLEEYILVHEEEFGAAVE